MPFKAGQKKTGGRRKGTPNVVTRELRGALKAFYDSEIEQLPDLVSQLSPKDRLAFLVKITPFILPRLDSIDCEDGERLTFDF